jgi:hypothetical protein
MLESRDHIARKALLIVSRSRVLLKLSRRSRRGEADAAKATRSRRDDGQRVPFSDMLL